jgi:hypothetical protein
MIRFRSIAERVSARDAYVWAFGLVLLAVLAFTLSGCGAWQDYNKIALGYREQISANSIMDLRQANDGELRDIAAIYCGVPRIGAVVRRYQDPNTLALRQQMCAAEEQLGFIGP